MLKLTSMLLSMGLLLFGAFSSSTHYDLNNYSLGAGGTNSSQSSTYTSQASLGEQANGTASGSTKKGNSGSIQAEQLSVPQAPALSNDSGIYYNKLQIVLNDNAGTNSYPTDVTFAIEVSTTSGFTNGTTYYLQASGSLNASAVFQTYSVWGGASGTFIVGLATDTTYYARVTAKEGQFTNTEFGASTNVTTGTPSTTFSVSPNSESMGSLLPGSIISSSSLTFGFSTNGANGGAVYVSGSNAGLYSTKNNYLIPAYSGNLSTPSQGFGIQASNATETSGGPFGLVSPFNGTGNVIGAETTVPAQILSSSDPITGGSANATMKAKSSSTTPAGQDYSETLTFIAAGYF